MNILCAEGVNLDKYYFKWAHILPAYTKKWIGFNKKPKEIEVQVWKERKYKGRVMCGTNGLMARFKVDGKMIPFEKFLYTTNPIEYYAMQTKEGQLYYFNNSDYNACLHVCSFNELVNDLCKY